METTETMFDTLAYTRTLTEHDFTQNQAEGSLRALQLAFAGGVATRNDIRDVRNDLKELDRKIDGVSKSLTRKIDGVSESLNYKIDGVSESLNHKIDSEYGKLDHKIDLMVNKLTRRMVVAMGVVAILTGLATSFL